MPANCKRRSLEQSMQTEVLTFARKCVAGWKSVKTQGLKIDKDDQRGGWQNPSFAIGTEVLSTVIRLLSAIHMML
ncbi:hypothetical protein VNO77_00991 [Canavalia gladiata]|uniref:Uncharacterized protein n=1 Tax=Canavalia gladiata TaxID=3824 RepID=A0AAN9R4X1_CANGL